MPNSVPVTMGVGWRGDAIGTAVAPTLKVPVRGVCRVAALGANWQVYDAFGAPLTIAGAATTTLNLTTGLTNPLGEAIAGVAAFAHVFGLLIEHDAASLDVTGIEAFGGASSNLFQGPWSAAAKATLFPGEWVAFGIRVDKVGRVVDATHKNIDLKNLHATLAATVHVGILGKTI